MDGVVHKMLASRHVHRCAGWNFLVKHLGHATALKVGKIPDYGVPLKFVQYPGVPPLQGVG